MQHDFEALLSFLGRLPAIDLPAGRQSIGCGQFEDGNWWVKFSLDLSHPLAWRHVQELGHVLNYLSPDNRLPMAFIPVSPPPYMNGGVDFLSWVLESRLPTFTPQACAQVLEDHLPSPVEDLEEWLLGDEDESPEEA